MADATPNAVPDRRADWGVPRDTCLPVSRPGTRR